jgi:hypothetical protein
MEDIAMCFPRVSCSIEETVLAIWLPPSPYCSESSVLDNAICEVESSQMYAFYV